MQMIQQSSSRLRVLMGLGISLGSFVVYMFTLSPTTDFIDSGELAAVAGTLGIAHPTGYPLFTLVGWVFSHLPLGLRPIYQLNMMSAVFCAAALYIYFQLFFLLVNGVLATGRGSGKGGERVRIGILCGALVGVLLLGFSETYWTQALSVEVYSLHLLLLGLSLYCFTKAILVSDTSGLESDLRRPPDRYLLIFAYVLGLSFANHMTTILLAPACLVAFFSRYRFSNRAWPRIGTMGIPFLAGLSVYTYLPVRAIDSPWLNWGNPQTLEQLFWHLSGKQYRVWLFSSLETAERQLAYYFETLGSEFAYIPLILAVFGLFSLFGRHRSLFVFTLLLFFSAVLYSINYDIHDIDSYFLLSYVVIGLWCAVGAASVINLMKRQRSVWIAISVLLAIGAIPLAANYQSVDESENYLVEDYTRDMLNSIEPNGIIFSYQWDYFISASYYFQLIEKLRPDVVIVDKELLRRSWYFEQLDRWYPWLIEQSREELRAFMVELEKFEHGRPYRGDVIESRYTSLIQSLIGKNYSTRAIYVTPEMEPQYTGGYTRVPVGVAFRLVTDTAYMDTPQATFSYRSPPKTNKYIEGIHLMYARAYLNRGIYEGHFQRFEAARVNLGRALALRPDLPEAQSLRERLSRIP